MAVLRLIERKRKAGEDVIAAPAAVEAEEGGGADIVDLMKYLKESVAGERSPTRERRQPIAAKRKTTARPKAPKRQKARKS